MARLNLKRHAYALDVSGYTLLPQQVVGRELDGVRECAERALQAVRDYGQPQPYVTPGRFYEAARCLYCWGEPCVRLLEHETLHELAALAMGQYLLWEISVLSALPSPPDVREGATAWHRDFRGLERGSAVPGHLWCFLCLDDTTAENGATWVVPGSHRISTLHEPGPDDDWVDDGHDLYPSRHQLLARAGDILVMNPATLHTAGHNASDRARRLLNIGICHGELAPLLDHWAIAGPTIQQHASPRLRSFLGGDRDPLDQTWPVTPPGWQSGRP